MNVTSEKLFTVVSAEMKKTAKRAAKSICNEGDFARAIEDGVEATLGQVDNTKAYGVFVSLYSEILSSEVCKLRGL